MGNLFELYIVVYICILI